MGNKATQPLSFNTIRRSQIKARAKRRTIQRIVLLAIFATVALILLSLLVLGGFAVVNAIIDARPAPDNNGDDNGNTGTTPEGAIVFDADVDKGNAGTDSNNATSYTITKDGVTITVSSGILGTYNNETHYRIYKNQTLTVTSTAGNVKKVTFTCTANVRLSTID